MRNPNSYTCSASPTSRYLFLAAPSCLLILSLLFTTPLSQPFAKEITRTNFTEKSTIVLLKPQIQLANLYHDNIDVKKYLVSEKLDGVHAYWDGEKLLSRKGNIFYAPKWFIANFPQEHLEGELWIGRGKFEKLLSTIRKKIPIDSEWQNVRLMLFDMPQQGGVFAKRVEAMKILVAESSSHYLKVIEQSKFFDRQSLMQQLDEMVKDGAEGLMLHRANSFYRATRNDDLLKLKTFEDAEARVIAHIPGKGRLAGMMGSLLVENSDKIRFKIGTGFSDEQRKFPPKIGSVITYKFFGKTKNNIPRFASFMRVRQKSFNKSAGYH